MRKTMSGKQDRQLVELINNLNYKYTHQIFNEFVSMPEMLSILNMLFSKYSIGSIISSTPVMKKHGEEYVKLITSLLN